MGEDHVFGVRIMRKNMKKHYHWIVAVVMLLELAVIGGLANNYSGLFILPITGELGITRASFSLAFCLKYLFSFLGTLLSGALFLRWGNKKPLLLGLLAAAAAAALRRSASSSFSFSSIRSSISSFSASMASMMSLYSS